MEPICTCHSIEFIPIDQQPQAFVSGLDSGNHARLLVACESAALGFVLGRPHGSRTTVIAGATMSGLFMLRIVWPGAPEPQLRLVCIRDGRQVLIARGFVQTGPRIPISEIELAELAIVKVREASDEIQGRRAQQRS
jgi:hypothetical protein